MRRSRFRVSYIIKDDYGDKQPHRAGINSLALDETTPTEPDGQAGGILYSAGRDAVVTSWECHIDRARHERIMRDRETKLKMHAQVNSPFSRSDSLQVPGGLAGSRELHRSRSGNNARKHRAPYSPTFLSSRQSSDLTPGSGDDVRVAVEADSGIAGVGTRQSSDEVLPQSPTLGRGVLPSPEEGKEMNSFIPLTGSPPSMSNSPLGTGAGHHMESFRRDDGGLLRKTRSVTFSGKSAPVTAGLVPVQKSFSSMDIDRIISAKQKYRQAPATLRRSFQHHSDWVNDVVLCNTNQHIVTASNDRTIYVTPTMQQSAPIMIGHHSDYVKCLAYSRDRGWVASGGLDRRILLWDLGEGKGQSGSLAVSDTAEVMLNESSPKSSVYALACNPSGSLLVSGSPDKLVRVWDLSQGKNVMRLMGHTENIRSLLVSDDARWVLSASSDATIKLWSLAMPHRPMVTYTHCEDSVYSLYSRHPYLDTFWAGGRDGWVTKVSRRRMVESSAMSSRSVDDELVDCVAICRESGPINRLVAIEDVCLWTATGSSTINRWRDVPFQHVQLGRSGAHQLDTADETDPIVIPSNCIIRPPTALDDAASVRSYRPFSTFSVDTYATGGVSMIPLRGEEEEEPPIEPAWKEVDGKIEGAPGVVKASILNNRRHLITEDSAGEVAMWDIIQCIKLKSFGKLRFSDVVERTNTREWVANWSTVDTHNGVITIHLDEGRCYDAEIYHDEADILSSAPNDEQRINLGKWVLTYLFRKFIEAWKEKASSKSANETVPSAAINPENSPARESPLDRSAFGSVPSQVMEGDILRVRMTPSVVSPTILEAATSYFAIGVGSGDLTTPQVVSPLPPLAEVETQPADGKEEVNSSRKETESNEDSTSLLSGRPSFDVESSSLSHQSVVTESTGTTGVFKDFSGIADDGSLPQDTDDALPKLSLHASDASRTETLQIPFNNNPGSSLLYTSQASKSQSSLLDTPMPNTSEARSEGDGSSGLAIPRSPALSARESSTHSNSLPPSPSTADQLARTASLDKATFMNKLKQHVRRRTSSSNRSDEFLPESSSGSSNVEPSKKREKDKRKDISRTSSKGSKISRFGDKWGRAGKEDDKDEKSTGKGSTGTADPGLPPPAGGPVYKKPDSVNPSNPNTSTPGPQVEQPVPPLRSESMAHIPSDNPSEKPVYFGTDAWPLIHLPPAVPVIISIEESLEAAAFLDVYRGLVGAMGWEEEVARVEKSMPPWVFDHIVENKPFPPKDPPKLSFSLVPAENSGLEPLPGGNPKLSANRMLRVRKLITYIVERLSLEPPASTRDTEVDRRPENWLEVLCGDEASNEL
ncbi:hypothetical protein DFS34DRAFT_650541 [Phlyctochytrium arcticum]|nr:hypothetical protein DFS34DRAFT_650541 [Phlyctochytrium arcticum]